MVNNWKGSQRMKQWHLIELFIREDDDNSLFSRVFMDDKSIHSRSIFFTWTARLVNDNFMLEVVGLTALRYGNRAEHRQLFYVQFSLFSCLSIRFLGVDISRRIIIYWPLLSFISNNYLQVWYWHDILQTRKVQLG